MEPPSLVVKHAAVSCSMAGNTQPLNHKAIILQIVGTRTHKIHGLIYLGETNEKEKQIQNNSNI